MDSTYQQPPASPPSPSAYPPQTPPPTSGLAIGSLICSIVGVSIIGVILGHIALSKIKNSGGAIGGKGLAVAGLVIGYLGMLIWVVTLVIIFLAAGTFAVALKNMPEMTNYTVPDYETETMVAGLEKGILFYSADQGTYPGAGGDTGAGGQDFVTTTHPGLVQALTAGDSPYLMLEEGALSPAGDLLDKWGKPYQVFMDTSGDGNVTVPITSSVTADGEVSVTVTQSNPTPTVIEHSVAVRSAGPDGEFGTADDVTSF